jgi:flagellar protein FlaG
MASVSVSHMIIFIASILVAASVVGVFTDSVNELSNAIDERGGDVSKDVRTDVEIISDSGADGIYDGGTNTTTLLVKNTGSLRLSADATQLDVLVDGRFDADLTVTLLGDGQAWEPGQVIRLEITENLDPGDHRVKIIVNGDEEVFEFRT